MSVASAAVVPHGVSMNSAKPRILEYAAVPAARAYTIPLGNGPLLVGSRMP